MESNASNEEVIDNFGSNNSRNHLSNNLSEKSSDGKRKNKYLGIDFDLSH